MSERQERARLEALRRYEVLDTPPEEAFNRIAQLAASVFNVPIALISLVDEGRQWFKACFGLDIRQTDRKLSFCAYAIQATEVMVVPDATQDLRFSDNPLVRGTPGIRFYAGAPLRTPDGFNLGSLCVIDTKPRAALNDQERMILTNLAATVIAELELKRNAQALLRSQEKVRSLVENALDAIVTLSPEGNFTFMNPAFTRITGHTPDAWLGKNFTSILLPEDYAAALQGFQAALKRESSRIELRVLTQAQDVVVLDLFAIPNLRNNKVHEVLVFARDVTERKKAERLERDRRELLRLIAENQPLDRTLDELIGMIERQYPHVLCCVSLLRGSRLQFLPGRRLEQGYLNTIDNVEIGPEVASCGAAAYLARAVIVSDIMMDPRWEAYRGMAEQYGLRACWSVPIVGAGGSVLGTFAMYCRKPQEPSREEFELLNLAAQKASIAIEHHQLLNDLTYQAQHDALTELPNRLLLERRLSQALARAKRNRRQVAVLFIDLDRFKQINDTLGHDAGDIVLKEAAARLEGCIRQEDTLARVGGDEFIMVLEEIDSTRDAVRVARKLIDVLERPFVLDEREVSLGATVGISLFPQDGTTAEELFKHADSAMYKGKTSGRNTFQLFTPEMNAEALERLEMENSLRRALERDEFEVHYQPQVELVSGTVVSVEALIRWRAPGQGLVSPGRFIPVAEETGLIVPIGQWVLREACRQLRSWQDDGRFEVKVAVNVSALQFSQPDFIDMVQQTLEETGLDAKWLVLELTESAVMMDLERASERLEQLRASGVRVALDDFGAGYSSLAHLKRLPMDILKIDKSVIDDVALPQVGHQDPSALARAMTALAHHFGLRVVAEGVETSEQCEALRAMGCDEFQGYLFSRPLKAADVVTVVSSQDVRLEERMVQAADASLMSC